MSYPNQPYPGGPQPPPGYNPSAPPQQAAYAPQAGGQPGYPSYPTAPVVPGYGQPGRDP